MLLHAPSGPPPFFAAEHAWQTAVHAELQHTPSAQYPDEQVLPDEHAAPLGLLPVGVPHAPEPLQSPLAHSLSGSVAAAIFPHVPFEPLPFLTVVHAWHVPVHAESQQTPSVQKPLEHSVFWVQGLPRPKKMVVLVQPPNPLHVPAHSLSGSNPLLMYPHVPSAPLCFLAVEHARQRPVQAVSQQTPSTQNPPGHCPGTVHGVALGLVSPIFCNCAREPTQSLPGQFSSALNAFPPAPVSLPVSKPQPVVHSKAMNVMISNGKCMRCRLLVIETSKALMMSISPGLPMLFGSLENSCKFSPYEMPHGRGNRRNRRGQSITILFPP